MERQKRTKASSRYKHLPIQENTTTNKELAQSYTSELLLKYKDYCARAIQRAYRNYKVKDQYNLFIRRRQLRKALLIGWKTRRIMNCKRLTPYKTNIKKLANGLNEELASKEYIEEFKEVFSALYIAGTWVDSCTCKYSKRHIVLANLSPSKRYNELKAENRLSSIPETIEEEKQYNKSPKQIAESKAITTNNLKHNINHDEIQLPVKNLNPKLRYSYEGSSIYCDSNKDNDHVANLEVKKKLEYLKKRSERAVGGKITWKDVESKVDSWKVNTPKKAKTKLRIAVVYKNL